MRRRRRTCRRKNICSSLYQYIVNLCILNFVLLRMRKYTKTTSETYTNTDKKNQYEYVIEK